MLRQHLNSCQIRYILILALNICKDLLGLSECDSSTQFKNTSSEAIFRRERGGIEIDYFLILALVESIVDV